MPQAEAGMAHMPRPLVCGELQEKSGHPLRSSNLRCNPYRTHGGSVRHAQAYANEREFTKVKNRDRRAAEN